MPRFSIKDLMLATTLMAVGLAIDFAAARYPWYPPPPGVRPGIVVLKIGAVFGAGAALIGAGALVPFQKKAIYICICAAICFVIATVFFFAYRMGPSV